MKPSHTFVTLFLITGLFFALSKIYFSGTIVERIFSFILFLCSFCLWLMITDKISLKTQRILTEEQDSWEKDSLLKMSGYAAITLLANIFFFFFSLWLIIDKIEWNLLVILVTISISSIILSIFLWESVGEPVKQWYTISMICSLEISKKHKLSQKIITFFPFVLIYILPIFVFLLYINIPYLSDHFIAFLILSILIIFNQYPSILITTIRAYLSGNVDTMTQLRIFLNVLPYHLLFSLFYVLPFLGFVYGMKSGISSVSLTNLPLISYIIIIVGYFLVFVTFPFYIGSRRSRLWSVDLLKKRKKWTNDLLSILKTPIGRSYVQKLNDLQSEINNERENRFKGDLIVEWEDPSNEYIKIRQGLKIFQESWENLERQINLEKTEINPQKIGEWFVYTLKRFIISIFKSSMNYYTNWVNILARQIDLVSNFIKDKKKRKLDPRLFHIDWLENFALEVQEIIINLSQKSSYEDQEDAAEKWTNKYEMQREEIIQQITYIQGKQYLGANAIISAAVIILTVILQEISKNIVNF